MSIATQIQRITGLRNALRTKLVSLGLLELPQYDTPDDRSGEPSVVVADDLAACVDAVESIGGVKYITGTDAVNVAQNQFAQVSDQNLRPMNIVDGVSILGVTGEANITPPDPDLVVGNLTWGGEEALPVILHPYPHDGFSFINIDMVPLSIRTLIPANVKAGVTIMGVRGTYSHEPGLVKTETDYPLTSGSGLPVPLPDFPFISGNRELCFNVDDEIGYYNGRCNIVSFDLTMIDRVTPGSTTRIVSATYPAGNNKIVFCDMLLNTYERDFDDFVSITRYNGLTILTLKSMALITFFSYTSPDELIYKMRINWEPI